MRLLPCRSPLGSPALKKMRGGLPPRVPMAVAVTVASVRKVVCSIQGESLTGSRHQRQRQFRLELWDNPLLLGVSRGGFPAKRQAEEGCPDALTDQWHHSCISLSP